MAESSINVHERLEALMARREQRNPGLGGTSKKPKAMQWQNLINDTTKKSMVGSFLKNLKSR
jgi:hypothetical protein